MLRLEPRQLRSPRPRRCLRPQACSLIRAWGSTQIIAFQDRVMSELIWLLVALLFGFAWLRGARIDLAPPRRRAKTAIASDHNH